MLKFEPLARGHNKKNFDCGRLELNRYLRETAAQHQEKMISKTLVLVDDGDPLRIIGFFSLTVCQAESEELPSAYAKKYPNTIPGAKIGRLAVAREDQGKGYGGILLVEAMRCVAVGAKALGIAAIFVDAKDDAVAKFYRRYGFIEMPVNKTSLFIPMKTVHEILSMLN